MATQIVLVVDGRPQRIKAPNDEAPKLRQTLQEALFDFYGVDSVAALNETVAPVEAAVDEGAGSDSDDLTLDSGIDPLVGGPEPGDAADRTDDESDDPAAGGDEWVRPAAGNATSASADPPPSGSGAPVEARVDELTAAVERQNELLERHQRTLEQLIEELRKDR